MSYEIELTYTSLKQIRKLAKRDSSLLRRLDNSLRKLQSDPAHPGIHTHKVSTGKYGEHYSSRVTGDLRLFWTWVNGKIVVLAFEDHSAYK